MKQVYQEDTPQRITPLLPFVQLLLNIPASSQALSGSTISAVSVAMGCHGRQTPLFIFDLAENSSIEEMVELLPMVCLYTPDDLCRILGKKHRSGRSIRDSYWTREQATSIVTG